ncbi:RDD family protein [Longispora albida]|uniref:RDD family protein n=1 Tax=Longispora albida TaxID=203523 RepID=UPI00037D7081|nr:RDD family protein [Longispora albida]
MQERLVSGEAVELDVRIARIGSRVLAQVLDVVIQSVLALLGVLTILVAFQEASRPVVAGSFIVLAVIVLVVYPVAMLLITRGRSVGKLAVGLRVVRDDGGPIAFRHALTRTLVGVAAEWPGLPPLTWLASLAVLLVSPRGKRIGDLTAGTIVIHDREPATWGWVPPMPPHLAGWARTLDISGLPADLALACRHYLARNRGLREPARSRIGIALAMEVVACTTPAPPPGTPGWAYLAAVLAERNRRATFRLAAARAASAQVWPDLGVRGPAATPAARPSRSQGLRPAAPGL